LGTELGAVSIAAAERQCPLPHKKKEAMRSIGGLCGAKQHSNPANNLQHLKLLTSTVLSLQTDHSAKTGKYSKSLPSWPRNPPSGILRAQLRKTILKRIDELSLMDGEAADDLGFTPAQMSRLKYNQDVFSLNWLVDVAENIGITVRMRTRRSYRDG
jgi:predicted XRE-type DNA-binding protein